MTPGDIYQVAYKLKAFQVWELIEELSKDWGFLGKSFVKERVSSWMLTQVKHKAIIKVNAKPPVFAFPEFKDSWHSYVRYRTCEVCGKTFIPSMPHQKVCSKECKHRHQVKLCREYRRSSQERKENKRFLPWNAQEEELLKQTFPDLRYSKSKALELSKLLKRSPEAIRRRLYELKRGAKV